LFFPLIAVATFEGFLFRSNNLISSSLQDDNSILKIGLLQGCFKLEEDEDEQQLLTLQDARKMAMEEPEMWEEIPLDHDEYHHQIRIEPEIHAAVKLNAFLWKHRGGWRNTFA
jgi:hypothetical protein